MTRKQMQDKYADAIKAMWEKTGDDPDVCFDKLVYAMKNLGNPDADVYEGIPEEFDFAAFAEDYKELIKPL